MQNYTFSFRNHELSIERELRASLLKIYGVGLTKTIIFTSKIGLPYPYFLKNMQAYYYTILICLINNCLLSEVKAKRFVDLRIKRLVDLKTYKGRRHFLRLPVRGQRSRTNGRTMKRLQIKNI